MVGSTGQTSTSVVMTFVLPLMKIERRRVNGENMSLKRKVSECIPCVFEGDHFPAR